MPTCPTGSSGICDKEVLSPSDEQIQHLSETRVVESWEPQGSWRLLSYVFVLLILLLLFPLKDFSFASQICMGSRFNSQWVEQSEEGTREPAGMTEQQPCVDQTPFLFVRHVLEGWFQKIQNTQSALITTPLACIGHFMVLKAVFGV